MEKKSFISYETPVTEEERKEARELLHKHNDLFKLAWAYFQINGDIKFWSEKREALNKYHEAATDQKVSDKVRSAIFSLASSWKAFKNFDMGIKDIRNL